MTNKRRVKNTKRRKKCDCWYALAIRIKTDFAGYIYLMKYDEFKNFKGINTFVIFKYCPKCGRKL